MPNFRKIKLLVVIIFMLDLVFARLVSSQDRKSPFEDCLPKKAEPLKVEKVIEEPVAVDVVDFDASIYKINGLIWGSYSPKAIINGEIYGVGDKLEGAKITKIDKNGVTLILDNKEYVIVPERKINIIEEGK